MVTYTRTCTCISTCSSKEQYTLCTLKMKCRVYYHFLSHMQQVLLLFCCCCCCCYCFVFPTKTFCIKQIPTMLHMQHWQREVVNIIIRLRMETTTVLVKVEYKSRLLRAKVKQAGEVAGSHNRKIFGRLKSLLTIIVRCEWEQIAGVPCKWKNGWLTPWWERGCVVVAVVAHDDNPCKKIIKYVYIPLD